MEEIGVKKRLNGSDTAVSEAEGENKDEREILDKIKALTPKIAARKVIDPLPFFPLIISL